MGRKSYNHTEPINDLVTWVYDDTNPPVAKITKNDRYTIIQDHLGTPFQDYNSKGELVWNMLLDIYGDIKEIESDRNFVPFRYQGQYDDEGTGLYYNRFKYYSPEIGNYISIDLIGLAGSNPTLYGYVKYFNIEELKQIMPANSIKLKQRLRKSMTTISIGILSHRLPRNLVLPNSDAPLCHLSL